MRCRIARKVKIKKRNVPKFSKPEVHPVNPLLTPVLGTEIEQVYD